MNFDAHYIIDTLLGIILAAGWWVVNQFDKRLNDHDTKLDGLPDTYARRDDVKDGFANLQAILLRMEERLNKRDA